MKDPCPPALQREKLLELKQALLAQDTSLRRDECGDWRISGKSGHVYAAPVKGVLGYQIVVFTGERPRAWGAAKKRLGFCKLLNDGDDEGVMFLDRLPTAVEAEEIRIALHIRKRIVYSPEYRAQLGDRMRENLRARGVLAVPGSTTEPPATPIPDEPGNGL